ncbi:MAG TPA: response regulator [Candidatus Didemnitutus sp.]|nr:response regulator [Candidatus Didemnitutus sp.]
MTSPQSSIVVVEDDASLSQAMERVLQASGFQTAAYRSSEDLLATGEVDQAAGIILDVELPGMTGFELCAELDRTQTRRPPIIFITAHDEPQIRTEAVSLGAAGFLIKPFSGRKLVETVHRALLDAQSRQAEHN